MPNWKVKLFCSFAGLGALSSAILVPTLTVTRGGQSLPSQSSVATKASTPKKKLVWPTDYTRTCWKWIIEMRVGELIACLDQDETRSQSDFPLLFYLWWLKGTETDQGYNTFTEVDSIKVESGNQISFSFTGKTGQNSEKRLTVKSDETLKNLSNLNNQLLKNICKIKTPSSPLSMSCDSSVGNYESKVEVATLIFWVSKP